MPKLMQVKGNGFALHWPSTFPQDNRLRGMAGTVIDAEHPLEIGYDEPLIDPATGHQAVDPMTGVPLTRHVIGWCEGQWHKLEDAPAGSKLTPLDHPTAIRVRNVWDAQHAPKSAQPAPVATSQNYSRRKPQRAYREIEG